MHRYFQIAVVLYIVISFSAIFSSQEVLYYDELLHAISAQKLLVGSEYIAEVPETLGHGFWGHRAPLMVLQYVGPLKTYSLAVWFMVLGDTVVSLRLFGVMIGSIYLFLTYLIALKFLSRGVAIVTVCLLALDPSFVLSRVFDWGPLAIQDVLKLIVLFICLDFLQNSGSRGSSRWKLFLLGFLSALLIWDKLNGWWWLAGMMVMIVFGAKEKLLKKQSLVILWGFLIGILPVVVFVIKRPWFYRVSVESFQSFERVALNYRDNYLLFELLQNYLSSIPFKIGTYLQVVFGSAIPDYILFDGFSLVHGFGAVLVFCVLYCLVFFKRLDPVIAYLGLVFGVVFLCILFTPQANAVHHWLMLYPIPHMVVAVVVVSLYRSYRRTVILLGGLYLISAIYFYLVLFSGFALLRLKPYWDGAQLSLLTEILQTEHSGLRVVALDWGINLPVGFLSKGHIEVRDLQPFYLTQCQKLVKLRINEVVFVRYIDEYSVFPGYYVECEWAFEGMRSETQGLYRILSDW